MNRSFIFEDKKAEYNTLTSILTPLYSTVLIVSFHFIFILHQSIPYTVQNINYNTIR